MCPISVEGTFKDPEMRKETNFSLFSWRASASAFEMDTLFLAYMFWVWRADLYLMSYK